MTTAIFSAIPTMHQKPTFVAAIADASPEIVVQKLQAYGIIAMPSESEEATVYLVGYNPEVQAYLRELKRLLKEHKAHHRFNPRRANALYLA
jgi:hypothetical protein